MRTRQEPTADSARVASPPGPASVRVAFRVHGGLVEYDGYSNDAWLPGVPTC
ncbi:MULTISPECIES: hypothetical protein [Streptomyces]|uniref:hypothetical protein n=1 Tax=Streptomyces TaxID=1883 RepID=UPI00135F19F1